MEAVLLLARLALAVIFLISGVAKLFDRRGTGQTLVAFGLPQTVSRPFSLLLPLAELGTAAALLWPVTAWWGALAALAMLLLFIAAISLNLLRDNRPDCHCFGQLSSAPTGWRTVLRNALLAAPALLLLWQGPQQIQAASDVLLPSLQPLTLLLVGGAVVLLLLLLGQGWLLLNLWRQNGRLLLRVEALEARAAGTAAHSAQPVAQDAPPMTGVGAVAAEFSLPSLDGKQVTLASLRAAGRPVLLIFTAPGCGPCQTLLPQVARWQKEHGERLTIALISQGARREHQDVAALGLANVLLQQERQVSKAYGVAGTPSAVLVRADGRTGSARAAGPQQVEQLLQQALKQMEAEAPLARRNGDGRAAPPAPRLGQLIPPLQLRNLEGQTVTLPAGGEQEMLILFWNPQCGYCQRMLPELQEWEQKRGAGTPEPLLISTGSVEDNRALNLRAPILLDEGFRAGRALGAGGTPSAVLVDQGGRIASPVVAGAPAVLALARGERSAAGAGTGGTDNE